MSTDVIPESSTEEQAVPRSTSTTALRRFPAGLVVTYVSAAVVVVCLDAVALLLLGADPTVALPEILRSSVGSVQAVGETIDKSLPLLLGGVAVVFAMRAGLLNLGVDGQIQFGAIGAAGFALAFPDLPAVVLLPGVLVAGVLGGAFIAAPPAVLRARFGVNELFTTVMLNFVAVLAVEYLTTGPWTDESTGEAIGRPIASAAQLGDLFDRGPHQGVIAVLVVALGLWVVLFRSRFGFAVRATGANLVAAHYGGIRASRIALGSLLISGCVAGLAGAIEVSGVYGRLIFGLATNFGYLSVLVAVLARRSLIGVIPVSFTFGALIVGSDSLQRSVNLPASTTLVFQAVTVLTVLVIDQVLQARREVTE